MVAAAIGQRLAHQASCLASAGVAGAAVARVVTVCHSAPAKLVMLVEATSAAAGEAEISCEAGEDVVDEVWHVEGAEGAEGAVGVEEDAEVVKTTKTLEFRARAKTKRPLANFFWRRIKILSRSSRTTQK